MDKFNLSQWTIFFVKNKDVFEKKLESFEEKDNQIIFKFKDRIITYFVKEVMDPSVIEFCRCEGYKVVVCNASKANLSFLIINWSSFKNVKDLMVIFANIELNKRLIIKPHIHNLISDPESLQQGLESLYNNTF